MTTLEVADFRLLDAMLASGRGQQRRTTKTGELSGKTVRLDREKQFLLRLKNLERCRVRNLRVKTADGRMVRCEV